MSAARKRCVRHGAGGLASMLAVAIWLIVRPATTAAACVGDCDGGNQVSIDEIITMVNIALGALPASSCSAGDADASGTITIDEVIAAVGDALTNCPPSATPPTVGSPASTPTDTPTLPPAQTPTPIPGFQGFDPSEVARLAADALDGRDNDTPGSLAAQALIIDQLRPIATGLDPSKTGDEAFKQPIPEGTNILAVIRGGELPDEYVMLGAHYDHFAGCADICNGATDNAAGVSAVLSVARGIAQRPTPPRRSMIFAFWDREEDGLIGSLYYVTHPLVPLSKLAAYLNFDIQGSNLLPSLRRVSFAVGGESGGARVLQLVSDAVHGENLDTRRVSAIFGQNRSDYINFLQRHIPTVFFSDSTGPCYHTSGDDPSTVDVGKLAIQSRIGFKLALALSEMDTPPPFAASPAIVFADAVVINDVVNTVVASDLALFSAADQETLRNFQSTINATVAAGPASFNGTNVLALLPKVIQLVDILSTGVACNGFLLPDAS
jgi:hypothetical protein